MKNEISDNTLIIFFDQNEYQENFFVNNTTFLDKQNDWIIIINNNFLNFIYSELLILEKKIKDFNKSLVIVCNDFIYSSKFEQFKISPTLQEAKDLIQFDRIERDIYKL
tara:strand:- start:708 stop:1034 length:327 start_codon:yes stop_codon:yes gene_type:complete